MSHTMGAPPTAHLAGRQHLAETSILSPLLPTRRQS
jgi:hypothetical protein